MNAAPPPERLAAWLAAYERRVAALAAALGERACRRVGVPVPHGAGRAWYGARAAWLGAPAPLSGFAAHANRLALLDEDALPRVLAALRLYPARGALRRIVSGAQRRLLAGAVGEQAFDALVRLGLQAPGADAAPPAEAADGTLAAAGHAMLVADGALTLDVAARLVSLTLQHAADARPAATGASTPFLADAALIFPEFTWLFG
ncbi:type III secretion protein HrpB4 [Massilia luteola]|uniref:type III secretion protein HrpB4 n=1 Tax=Massilia luteola TaxID=3081751 RepID=UPI002ACBFDF0|nr:type III secretion protein HrpB4 [Massilia sp. Gc5]